MIVIGDVIGNRRQLRLQPGMAGQIERPLRIHPGQRPARLVDGAIVLGQPLQRLPAQVEAIETGITAFKFRNDSKGMAIVIKAAPGRHDALQGILPAVAEGRMAQIMGQRQRLGKVFIDGKGAGEAAGNLRHLQTVRQADPEMIAIGRHKYLSFIA